MTTATVGGRVADIANKGAAQTMKYGAKGGEGARLVQDVRLRCNPDTIRLCVLRNLFW